jgi:uncharacterized protein (DUF736 family)
MSDLPKNTQKNEWQEREIGALWKRKSATQSYLAGHIDVSKFDAILDSSKMNVVIFYNRSKQKDSHPDYRLYLSKETSRSNDSVEKSNIVADSIPEEEEVLQ